MRVAEAGRGRLSARDALARLEAIGDSDVSPRLVPPPAGSDGARPVQQTNDLESALHKIFVAVRPHIQDAGSFLISSDIATEVLRHAYSVGCPQGFSQAKAKTGQGEHVLAGRAASNARTATKVI